MMKYSIILSFIFALVACGGSNDKSPKNNNDGFNLTDTGLSLPATCGRLVVPIEEDPMAYMGFDRAKLNKELETGMTGYIHGAVHEFGHYVLSYGPTLQSIQLSLVASSRDLAGQFKQLNRHDKVSVIGKLIANSSPVPHILVTELKVVKAYSSPATGHNEYAVDLNELLGQETAEILVKVHANVADGKALVVGYKDAVLPVIINPAHIKAASKLYRGDKIQIKVAIINDPKHPERPAHLATDTKAQTAITVLDSMVNCHRKKVVLKGTLVKFFKSPQISFDVFAIKQVDKNGIERNFTLFPDMKDENVDFMEVFTKVGERAEKSWSDHEDTAVVGRNNLYNSKLEVSAAGWINVVSKNQANPQIMLKSKEDITFTFVE